MRAVCLVGVVLFLGCAGYDGPRSPAGEGGDSGYVYRESDGLTVGLRVNPVVAGWGQSLAIDLRILNESDRPVEMVVGPDEEYGFCMRNSGGAVVAHSGLGQPHTIGKIVRFEPGDVVERSWHWRWEDPGIPSGVYGVTGGVGAQGLLRSSDVVELELR